MFRTALSSARAATLALAGVLVAAAAEAGPAQIVIINVDPPGAGLNDPTPAAPVGGNTGTTLGQQRLIVLEHAAAIWHQYPRRSPMTDLNDGAVGQSGMGGDGNALEYHRPSRQVDTPRSW
jgi:hypothetical protein